MKMKKSTKFFAADELSFMTVQKEWTSEILLAQEGIFFLKDVSRLLPLDSTVVKKRVLHTQAHGADAWEVMGVKKIWNNWVVRMKIFGPYYKSKMVPIFQRINKKWDANQLLRQKVGVYRLSDVCKKLPFSASQLRYQCKQRGAKSRDEIGIWKDPELNVFLVDIRNFAPWIKYLWSGGFETAGKKSQVSHRSKKEISGETEE